MSMQSDSPQRAIEPGLGGLTTVGLIKRLMDELATLIRQEIALAKAELNGSLKQFIRGASSVALGLCLALGGFLALLAAAILGLAIFVAPWLAALIVGAALLIIGIGVAAAGAKAMGSPEMRQSTQSLHKDKDVLSRSVS